MTATTSVTSGSRTPGSMTARRSLFGFTVGCIGAGIGAVAAPGAGGPPGTPSASVATEGRAGFGEPRAGAGAAAVGGAAAPAMARILAELDPATDGLELRFDLDYIDPSHPPDGVRRRNRTVALLAGERFLVETGPRDGDAGAGPYEQAVAFDGEYAYLRSIGTPGWLVVSRGYQVWPELAALGVLDQSGRGIGWFGAEGRTLSLVPAPLVERRVDRRGERRAVLLAPPDGDEASRRSLELMLDDAGDGPPRIVSVIEQELESEERAGGHHLRRVSIVPTEWRTMDGLELPSHVEFRSERPGVGGRITRETIMIETLAAERVSAEHVDGVIEEFTRPRAGETIFLVEWRMLYRPGDSSFQVGGTRYATSEPLGPPATLRLDELLASAQHIGEERRSGAGLSTAVFGRWVSVLLGAALIALSVVIWRRR